MEFYCHAVKKTMALYKTVEEVQQKVVALFAKLQQTT
jgi:hypothetical protein